MLTQKLIELSDNVWKVDGEMFGIEKIAPRDYVVFRLFGSRRIYIRETGFPSRDMALMYLEPMIEKYNSSIITALTK